MANAQVSYRLHADNILCCLHQLHSNTVSRSSLFCALVNAIEFCKTESVIDIFEIIKAIRIQKPGAIQTVVSCAVSL